MITKWEQQNQWQPRHLLITRSFLAMLLVGLSSETLEYRTANAMCGSDTGTATIPQL
jgi:hypothetical protein